MDVAVAAEIIDKSGSWYSYEGERIGQGRENVKRFLKENPDIYDKIYLKARETMGFVKKDVQKDAAKKDAAKEEGKK
jgi:recombination protein RecA